ncbi:ParB/Srx family N-terminal domain-containing protein [Streptomyces kaempferi]|uniref:ParB/Srx family N-terminal domain-containing protein n=1 Tax=Streptomyces kaempferi TaxID=333725 RepID=A0ABW3XIF8_9ACTN
MISTMSVAEALTLLSGEVAVRGLGDTWTVRDALDNKRTSVHYQDLLDDIRRRGIITPVLIRYTEGGQRSLVEGHHRITVAVDAGLPSVPWTDDPMLVDRIEGMRWQLTPGVITPEAVAAFERDACAGLALAVHDETGWPLIEVGYCDGLPIRVMVRRPDGRLLDIRGTHTTADVADEFEFDADDGTVTFVEVSRAAVWACYRDDCGEPVPMEIARTFVAEALLLGPAS